MPVYCFTHEGHTVEVKYPVGDAPNELSIEGKVFKRDIAAEHGGFCDTPGNWPVRSDAAGVHPSQRRDAHEQSVQLGVPTQFDSQGRAIFTSPSHRRDYCRKTGFFDRNAGYSDP